MISQTASLIFGRKFSSRRRFEKLNKHWASAFGDLGIASKLPETLGDAKLRQTDSGYPCEITQHLPKLNEHWRIDQDGKLIVVSEDCCQHGLRFTLSGIVNDCITLVAKVAEGVGFEPTEPFGSPVFKTAEKPIIRCKCVLLPLCLH